MPIKTRAIESSLPQKGFVPEVRAHIFFWFRFQGRDCGVFTQISHGDREIGEPLIAKMAKQVRLSKREFLQLVECPMSHDDYVKKLREQGILPPSP